MKLTKFTFTYRGKNYRTIKEIAIEYDYAYDTLRKRYQRRSENNKFTAIDGEIITLNNKTTKL